MADGRHVGANPNVHPLRIDSTRTHDPLKRLDLEEAFSHFWTTKSRNPRSRITESFGRGDGRGGDRVKFSWKRDDGHNNSSTSNVTSGSDDTSLWDAAETGKQAAEGGVWIPKSQGSSKSTGEGIGRQISTPPRCNPGKQNHQICYVGRIILKTSGAMINVSKWPSAVGSKGVMEVAWVKISNVPVEKRSERNLAYVASLVGVPLEIDTATLHCPASARVKIGCRKIDDIPSVAESVLGGHFYDFYYEVDQLLVRNPNRDEYINNTMMTKDKNKQDENDNDVNKKSKFDGVSGGLEEKLPLPLRLGESRIRCKNPKRAWNQMSHCIPLC
ncbi:hypothetical protein D1007_36457 [Hordeum vulgare]|nr:hypothetical protein D1007_36457 [Hordeum vulgare]